MLLKGSRYQKALLFSTEINSSSFKGMRPRIIGLATGVLEYTVKEGDRLDLLSLNFYNDSQKWWRLLDANPDIVFAADLTLDKYIGETILIPKVKEAGER